MARLRQRSDRKPWPCWNGFRSTPEPRALKGSVCVTHQRLGKAGGTNDMRCPYCGCENTQVKDSRPTEENQAIRRRRSCEDCGGRFTTFERVQLREIMVAKRSGRRVPFDR